jgi:hypothetical protein
MQTFIIFLLLVLFASCDRKNGSKNTNLIQNVQRISSSIEACKTENYFWSKPIKLIPSKQGFYGLMQFSPNQRLSTETKVFYCNERNEIETLATGLAENQIIDFDIDENENIFLLRSNDSGKKDPWLKLPLRELIIENTTTKNKIVVHDSTLKDAIKYDEALNPKPSNPFSLDKTLMFASFSELQIGRLKIIEGNAFVSYVGTGGYKLGKINLITTAQNFTTLMPNTTNNSMLFDREALKFDILGDDVALIVPFHGSDKDVYEKHFNREVTEDSNLEGQSLALLMDINLKYNQQKVITDDRYLSSGNVKLFNNSFYVLLNSHGDDKQNAELLEINLSTMIIKRKAVPAENMSYATALEVCHDSVLVGGSARYKQVSTGSIVKPGDAFLWVLNQSTGDQSLNYFGTDRNDTLTSIACGKDGLYISGIENGPITHSGDNDSSLLHQQSFMGIYKK